METVQVRIFKDKKKARKYADKMNSRARVFRYEVKPYRTGYGAVQGWKVRKVRIAWEGRL